VNFNRRNIRDDSMIDTLWNYSVSHVESPYGLTHVEVFRFLCSFKMDAAPRLLQVDQSKQRWPGLLR